MKRALDALQRNICHFSTKQTLPHSGYNAFIDGCTVALMAGGDGSRLKNVTGPLGVHKTSYVLPRGETMIERTVRMFACVGFTQFVALVYNHADSIIDLLGDGSRFGVSIVYSRDPEHAVGKGGAVKNALMHGVIDPGRYLIVHNPDDVIVGDTDAILRSVVTAHLHNHDQGALASVVVVEGSPYAYSGMKIEGSRVTDVEMYPFVPIPAHIGMTIFSPGVYQYFHDLFDLQKKSDFEQVLFPVLNKQGQLFAARVPTESWIPVNDEKGLRKLIAYIEKH